MIDIRQGDCLKVMAEMPDRHVDMSIFSPPYEDARTYGIDFKMKGQDWVDWMIPIVVESCRVTDGLVFVDMAGKVLQFKYSPVVEWLVSDLTRLHGVSCGPAPYAFQRSGIPGSGGPHYHRRNWEPVYGFALADRLPVKWSDNTAMGHPPKWEVGGQMSYRHADGRRKNASAGPKAHNRWGVTGNGVGNRKKDGGRDQKKRPSHNGEGYQRPPISNPGNVISGNVGKGHMGDDLAHENEAPFPEWLIEFFVRSYCPPDGTVLDPFCGSGTTLAVARKFSRNAIGIDLRESQVAISKQRVGKEKYLQQSLLS